MGRRELLERGLLLLPAAEAAQLWPIYAQVEAQFGTAASQAELAKRRAAAAADAEPPAGAAAQASGQMFSPPQAE